MSEYNWPVKKAWIGIENDTNKFLEGDLPEPTKNMCVLKDRPGGCVGVVIRSGQVRALGHFCFIKVAIDGKKVFASGAEDRIYPFHSVKLSELKGVPKGMIPALGFAKDGSTYCFLYKGKVVSLTGPGKDGPDKATTPVPAELWQPGWGKAAGGWSAEPEPPKPVVPDSFFRQLSAEEVAEFKAYSREHYVVGSPIDPVWHPICREECQKMNEEVEKVA